MKSIKIFISGVAGFLVTGMLLVSCKKTFDEKVPGQYEFTNSSIMQVYMATVGTSRNYVYVDAKPVTGAAMVLGSVFPTTGYGFKVPAGLTSFLVRDTLSTSTQVPLAFTENLQFNKTYSLFMYDTISSPKQKTVLTEIVIPSDTTARIRFANFAYSPVAIPAVDIYSANKKQNVFTNVQVTDVTSYIPYESGKADTFYVRPTGTTTNLQNWITTAVPPGLADIRTFFTPTRKRSYTIMFRGGYRSTVSTIGSMRALTAYANY
ncbi:MAG: hypothetical protein WBC06_02120 [Chitinophagaceae bacterium]